MSGIEVAGLVLGGLPILFEALDSYKKGMKGIKSALHRRKTIEELARAVQMQEVILDLLIKNILLHMGRPSSSSDTNLRLQLQGARVSYLVEGKIGTTNFQILTGALDDCLSHVQKAIAKIATFVPSVQDNAEIQDILNANRAVKHGKIDLVARIVMSWTINDLKNHIAAIDRSSSTLERFVRLVLPNASPVIPSPSPDMMKQAYQLQTLCHSTDHLYHVLVQCWSGSCHTKHEVRLFLNDNIVGLGQADRSEQLPKADTALNTTLSAYWNEQCLWSYDTIFYLNNSLANDHACDGSFRNSPRNLQQAMCSTPIRVETELCSAVESAANDRAEVVLHLPANIELAVSLVRKNADTSNPKANLVSLDSIFNTCTSQKKTLPWKNRMILAIKATSSFLRFFRTPWVQSGWSARHIYFELLDINTSEVDLRQPSIIREFTDRASTQKQTLSPLEDLIELGILLLEIWHGTTIEEVFPAVSLQSHAGGGHPDVSERLTLDFATWIDVYSVRHAYAWKWFHETGDSLPNLYSGAIRHCITDLSIQDQVLMGDNSQISFWSSTYQNLVGPLLKLSQI